jgi:hypothetical protein
MARLQAVPEQRAQDYKQAQSHKAKLAQDRQLSPRPAFRLIHTAKVFFISG